MTISLFPATDKIRDLLNEQLVAEGIKKGVLTLTAKKKLRLLPPLTITYPEIDRGLAALTAASEALKEGTR